MLSLRQPLRVAVLTSNRAPGVLELAADVSGRLSYDIVCVISSADDFLYRAALESRHVPVVSHPIRQFFESRKASLFRDFETRAEYDAETTAILQSYGADLVLTAGYVFMLTAPFLDAYAGRALNLHFSDLTIRRRNGHPEFPGLRAVRDAIVAGQPDTRATVHLVNGELDGGAPLVRSWPFEVPMAVRRVAGGCDSREIRAYARWHEQWMIRRVSAPLFKAALALVADSVVDLQALARLIPAAVLPWDVDENGMVERCHTSNRNLAAASA